MSVNNLDGINLHKQGKTGKRTYSPAKTLSGKAGSSLVVHWTCWYSFGSAIGSCVGAQPRDTSSKELYPRYVVQLASLKYWAIAPSQESKCGKYYCEWNDQQLKWKRTPPYQRSTGICSHNRLQQSIG